MSDNSNGVIIKRNGDLLVINKIGLIKIINDNIDKDSKKIDGDLIKMISIFYGRLSVGQLKWILEKVKFIIRHNKKYGKLRGIKDVQLI
jgi:hypothetical protein